MNESESHHHSVLVVDDDISIRKMICYALRREGYTLHEARNGREALTAMKAGNEELVLLDLMMPEVSGWEVLETRRESPELQKIPVIVISANHGPELGNAIRSGICAFLPKPFDLSTLSALVKSCLAHPHGPGGQHAFALE